MCFIYICSLRQTQLKDCDEVEFPILRHTVQSANRFFRMLRENGVFLSDPVRAEAMECSKDMCETKLRSKAVLAG